MRASEFVFCAMSVSPFRVANETDYASDAARTEIPPAYPVINAVYGTESVVAHDHAVAGDGPPRAASAHPGRTGHERRARRRGRRREDRRRVEVVALDPS